MRTQIGSSRTIITCPQKKYSVSITREMSLNTGFSSNNNIPSISLTRLGSSTPTDLIRKKSTNRKLARIGSSATPTDLKRKKSNRRKLEAENSDNFSSCCQ